MPTKPEMEIVSTDPKDTPNSIENYLKRILLFLGEDPLREGLLGTPERIRKSWEKLFGGYKQKAEDILEVQFQECGEYDEMIILKDIDFFSTCEHHFLPIIGKAHIAYIPKKGVVGISKLARLVEIHSRRLQIQEKMTADIANDFMRIVDPMGVGVFIEAQHFCIASRGVEKINSKMVTSSLLGVFREKPEVRSEFLGLCKGV